MSFFDGLHGYEVAMLAGGCLLFLTALGLLVYFALAGRPFGKLIPLLVLAIVMIGFPAYTKIQISKDGVTLETDRQSLLQNPSDTALRQNVAGTVARLAARPIQDPGVLVSMAHAQIALGNNDDAQKTVVKILQASPRDPQGLQLKQRLELDQNLEQLSTRIEHNASDEAAKSELTQLIGQTQTTPIASPVTMANIARAHAALGNQAQARENLDKALKINPSLPAALNLKAKLNAVPQA
jgi:tetratricopeptide (TPR) repeat protein